jgi:predicted dehydrogenase/nucleoside-diphosphate-sugar epimerase
MRTVEQILNVGFLGTGYIADWHARALRSVSGVRLVAACDRDQERVRAFAARHGTPCVYNSLSAMLAEGRVDVVHVLLPPDLHGQATGEIVDAGLHVLLEKPMATSVETCADLIERAHSKGVKIGVSHNFLFAPIHERLKDDLKSGRLGRPDEITITWNKGLDLLQTGPYDLWILRAPQHIFLDIGPHSVAHLLDLVGSPEIVTVGITNPYDLPSGIRVFRRWHVEAAQASLCVMLNFSFAPGFSEHSIHIRGSLASATADFERNSYLLHRHTKLGLDFDRYCMTAAEAKALQCQARRTLGHAILSKLRPSSNNPYAESIARALRSFYGHLGKSMDPRLSAELGRDVVGTCLEILRRAASETGRAIPPAMAGTTTATFISGGATPRARPNILVTGATGFVGRELVRQLVAQGHFIRALVRNATRLPPDVRGPQVEVTVANLSKTADLGPALEGIRSVYHLARPHVKTWEEFAEQEVAVTRQLAEACLGANVKRLIYTGTIDCYYAGAKAGTITENTPLDPHIKWRNYYAQAKALSEQTLMALHRERGLPVVVFRPGIVIGRGASPFHWGVGMWSWNALCQIWGHGRNPLPFVLVEDVVAALVTGLNTQGIEGESFNLVADSRLGALDYLKALEEYASVEFQKIPTPPWKFYLVDVAKWLVKRVIRHHDRRRPSYRDWETRTQQALYDCSKARMLLNWNPTSAPAEIIRRGIQLSALELL